MNQMVVYCPTVDDRAEREELQMLRNRVRANVERQRVETATVEAVTQLQTMKQAEQRAKRAARAEEARRHQRNLGYWIGAIAGMLMVLGWMFTKDFGITALPALLGAILMGRLK